MRREHEMNKQQKNQKLQTEDKEQNGRSKSKYIKITLYINDLNTSQR